jgi:hypothetical protein
MAPRLLKSLMPNLVLQLKRMIATFVAHDPEARPKSGTSTSHSKRPATETEFLCFGFALVASAIGLYLPLSDEASSTCLRQHGR